MRDRLGRLEAEIDADQARERAQQQAGADQEHDRQRDLRHHEQASHLMMPAIGGASPALLPQRGLRFDAAGLPRGHEPEDERRDGGHHEREDQARGIETDRLGAARRSARPRSASRAPAWPSTRAASPAAPPNIASTRLSMTSCLTRRPRLAPSDARSASSPRRPIPRAINRPARFTHAMTSTVATTAISSRSAGRPSLTRYSCSPDTNTPMSLSSGY